MIEFIKNNRNKLSALKRRIVSNLRAFVFLFVTFELLYLFAKEITRIYLTLNQIIYIFNLILISFCIAVSYFLIRYVYRILKSKRWDLLFSNISVFMLFIFLHKNDFTNWSIHKIHLTELVFNYMWLVLLLCSILLFITAHLFKRKNDKRPLFLSDDAIEGLDDDCLDIENDAEIFSEQVLNNMSKNSLVFGIDAPWGLGKSSFINICKKYWNHNNDVVVLDFEALRFEDPTELFKKFVEELTKTIRRTSIAPEIQSTFQEYALSIMRHAKIHLGGLSFPLLWGTNIENRMGALKSELRIYDKKIIIIIDDLDRLQTSNIKTILDIIKKSFVLPNLTYILCYDTENMGRSICYNGKTKKTNNENLIEYLEKIVNIKKTLTIPRSRIRDFLIKNIQMINTGHSLPIFPSGTLQKINIAIDDIFSSMNYHMYVKYLGDLRKVKRFLNIFKMQVAYELDIVKNFNKIDVNFSDLLHLILIYINYPKIFRKIHITETDGGTEFFSLKRDYTSSNFRYIHSPEYIEYIKDLNPDEKFLLLQIFDAEKYQNEGDKDFEFKVSTSAAFNGTFMTGRNLEDYLKIIVDRTIPNIANAYTIHQDYALKFINGTSSIEDIFNDDIYKFQEDNNAEKYRSLFLRILLNNVEKLTYHKAVELIKFMIDDLKQYSVVEDEILDLGLRKTMILNILYILDKKGWKDPDGNSYANTPENITYIAEHIFGEGDFVNSGILANLMNSSSDNLTLNLLLDTLHFRLFSCLDRGGGMYNLYNSLQTHNKSIDTDSTSSNSIQEEMRSMSQIIFAEFKKVYINEAKNIFKEIEDLTIADLFGVSEKYVLQQKDEASLKIITEKEKTIFRIFLIYQLANTNIQSGIGMGYFDETGDADDASIRDIFTDYLYNVCFNTNIEENIGFFMDYMLGNMQSKHKVHSDKYVYIPDINRYDESMDKVKLLDFWEKNSMKIKEYVSRNKNKIVIAPGYSTTYDQNYRELFNMLDTELDK